MQILMNSRPNSFQTDLVMLRKLHQERTQNCLAFLIQGFFSSVFLFVLEKSLVIIQVPVLMVFIALYVRPSFSKKLLPQQYMGLVALGFCALKSLYLIVNMIIYLSYFFNSNTARDPVSTSSNSVFVRFAENNYLFPDIAPRSTPGISSFLGVMVIILLALMTFFEILSLYVSIYIMRRTRKIVEKVKTIRFPRISETDDNALNVQNAEENDRLSGVLSPFRHTDVTPNATDQEL